MSNLKTENLQQEGKLQNGDLISTHQHGKCEVEWIDFGDVSEMRAV